MLDLTGPARRYSEASGRYRRIPAPHGFLRRQRPDEPWQDYARYLEQVGYSSRAIGLAVGKHHTTVLRVINPEFRRDKSIADRRRRAARTPDEVREDSLARLFRRDSASEVRL